MFGTAQPAAPATNTTALEQPQPTTSAPRGLTIGAAPAAHAAPAAVAATKGFDAYMKSYKSEQEVAARAGYRVAYTIAKHGKLFTDGEFITECMIAAAKETCPEKARIFEDIILPAVTLEQKASRITNRITCDLLQRTQKAKSFSLALEESTDYETTHVLLFLRGITSYFEVYEELLDVISIHSKTTGEDIFKRVNNAVGVSKHRWKKLKYINTDLGRNICEENKGVVALVLKAVENDGGKKPLVVHGMIHKHSLCGKCLDMSEVLKPVISAVNFIRSELREFIKETGVTEQPNYTDYIIESDYTDSDDTDYSNYDGDACDLKYGRVKETEVTKQPNVDHATAEHRRKLVEFIKDIGDTDLPYYTEVSWAICGKVLKRFYELRTSIKSFLNEKNHPLAELENNTWLWKLSFYTDLTEHVNDLIFMLQQNNQLLPDLYNHIKSFQQNIDVFQSELKEGCFTHFNTCREFNQQTQDLFPVDFAIEALGALKTNLESRISDLAAIAKEIAIFQNPFQGCPLPDDHHGKLASDILNIRSSDTYKEKYLNKSSLLQFHSSLLNSEFTELTKMTRGILAAFGSTYRLEKTISILKAARNTYRPELLTDEYLKTMLLITTSDYAPPLGGVDDLVFYKYGLTPYS